MIKISSDATFRRYDISKKRGKDGEILVTKEVTGLSRGMGPPPEPLSKVAGKHDTCYLSANGNTITIITEDRELLR